MAAFRDSSHPTFLHSAWTMGAASRGTDGRGCVWLAAAGLAGAANTGGSSGQQWSGRNWALGQRSVFPGPVSVSIVGHRVTETPGTPGPAGEPLLVCELVPLSGLLAAPGAAFWEGPGRERPQAGGAEEESQPPGRGGGSEEPPGAGRDRARTGPGPRGREQSTAGSRAWPGKWNSCGGGRVRAGPCGRRRGRTGLRDPGAARGRSRPGPAPVGVCSWRPRPARAPPVPLSRGDPIPPPAQGGPGDPCAPSETHRGAGTPSPGAAGGAEAPVPGALPAGQPPLSREGSGASPPRSPSVSPSAGHGGVAMATNLLRSLFRCLGNRSRCHPC